MMREMTLLNDKNYKMENEIARFKSVCEDQLHEIENQ